MARIYSDRVHMKFVGIERVVSTNEYFLRVSEIWQ